MGRHTLMLGTQFGFRRAGLRGAAFALVLVVVGACADAPDPHAFDAGVAAYDAGDYAKAYGIFREMADQDDLGAMRNVALMLRNGQGVDKDPEGARKWMLRAAQAGLPTAQADLGQMLLDGEGGTPDPASAVPWLQAAAAANHPVAQFELGEIYEAGKVVPRDMKLARQYYSAAAAAGVVAARDRLDRLDGISPADLKPSTSR